VKYEKEGVEIEFEMWMMVT